MIFVVIATILTSLVQGKHIQGCFGLDNTTLDKWLEFPNHTLLLKFDEQHAYGPKAKVFEDLCEMTHLVEKFFIAEVELVQWGVSDKLNYDLRQRYGLVGVHRDNFPVYFIHNDDFPKGKRYKGSIKHARLINWLRRYNIDLPWDARNLTEFEKKSEKFLSHMKVEEHKASTRTARVEASGRITNDPALRTDVDKDIRKFQKMAQEYESFPIAQAYVNMMIKVKEKGITWIAKEKSRIQKMMDQHDFQEAKEEELADKLTVLQVYLEKLAKIRAEEEEKKRSEL